MIFIFLIGGKELNMLFQKHLTLQKNIKNTEKNILVRYVIRSILHFTVLKWYVLKEEGAYIFMS